MKKSKKKIIAVRILGYSRIEAALNQLGFNAAFYFDKFIPHASDDFVVSLPRIYEMMEFISETENEVALGSLLANLTFEDSMARWSVKLTPDSYLSNALTQLIIGHKIDSTQTSFLLCIGDDLATIEPLSIASDGSKLAQPTAFHAQTFINLILKVVHPEFDSKDLTLFISDPDTIEAKTRERVNVKISKQSGFKITLPCDWLVNRRDQPRVMYRSKLEIGASNSLDVIKMILAPHIGSGILNLDRAATLLSITPRGLQQELKANGSTFRELHANLQQEFAELNLRRQSISLSEISDALGYSDYSAFSRAFKRRTGISPEDFRKSSS